MKSVNDAKHIYQDYYKKWLESDDRYNDTLDLVLCADSIFRQLFGDDFRDVVRDWEHEVQDIVYGGYHNEKN